MQGFVVGYVGKRVNDRTTLLASVIILSLSYLMLVSVACTYAVWRWIFCVLIPFQMLTTNLLQLGLILIPMIMGGALINTLTSSTITKVVPETATGTSLGLSMATHAIIRTVSPTLGGYIYQTLGYPGFGALGFVMSALMTGVLLAKGGIPGL